MSQELEQLYSSHVPAVQQKEALHAWHGQTALGVAGQVVPWCGRVFDCGHQLGKVLCCLPAQVAFAEPGSDRENVAPCQSLRTTKADGNVISADRNSRGLRYREEI